MIELISVERVLAHYPALLRQGRMEALGNAGGFSGAGLFRLHGPQGDCCIRAWPVDPSLARRLPFIHALMDQARRAGLSYVPAVLRAVEGATYLEHAGRCWDVTEWKVGQADYHIRPSAARLEEACRCLAQLHTTWEMCAVVPAGVCPGLLRRRQRWLQWRQLVDRGWRPGLDFLSWRLIDRAWRVAQSLLTEVPTQWLLTDEVVGPLHPCLCDVWHDHLLFTGDRLTGLIDYGSVQVDHPAVDLARLLGSLVEDDESGWQVGLQSYRRVRPFSPKAEELARRLDRCGVVLALTTWLRWFCVEDRPFEDRQAAAERLQVLVRRLEKW
jgi:homoserine kinase type II